MRALVIRIPLHEKDQFDQIVTLYLLSYYLPYYRRQIVTSNGGYRLTTEPNRTEIWKKKLETKDQAKWAEWARKLKNTLTDLHAQTCFKTFISPTFNRHSFHQHSFHQLKIKKKIEVNELSELDYSKAPSMMSSYTQEHVFLYLHAQTIINTLLYWSYTKS